MEQKKVYLVLQVMKREAKKGLKLARKHFGRSKWEDLAYETATHPLWVESTKEGAIRECRQANRESEVALQYFIELTQY